MSDSTAMFYHSNFWANEAYLKFFKLKLLDSDLFESQIKTRHQVSGSLWTRIKDSRASHLEANFKT